MQSDHSRRGRSLIALTLFAFAPAFSSADSGTTADSKTPTELSPITVEDTSLEHSYALPTATTGTKTDTPVMETPLSIQVVTQQALQDQKATTLDQALTNVSGVLANSKIYSGWTDQIYLRGFLTNTTFREGFRLDDPQGWNGLATLSNIDSIEVLKGPAAILYGRVEPGGMVNLVTKKPQDNPYYSFEQSVGSWNHYITSIDATNSFNADKTLLYRLNASYDTSQSWRENIRDARTFIAPTLEWRISPTTQVLMEASYSHNPKVIDLGYYPVDLTTNQFAPTDIKKDPVPIYYTADTTSAGLTLSHQLNADWTIKQQIRHHEVTGFYPSQPIVNNVYQNGSIWTFDRWLAQISPHQTTDGSVLDLTGHFGTAGFSHTLLTGVDYYRFRLNRVDAYSAPGALTTWINPAPATGLALDPTLGSSSKSTTGNLGLYVQDQMSLPNNIFLLVGWRYQDVKITGTTSNGTSPETNNTPLHDSATTPRYGLLLKMRDWLSFYGNYAENFGANNGVDWQGQPLPPEGAKQKEIGAKTELLGGKLLSTLALFDLTKTNVAVCDLVHDRTCSQGILTTVGAINSRGVELDLQGELLPRWNAILAYTYDRVIVTNSTPGSYYTQGNRMADDPEHMLRMWSTYALKGRLDGWKFGGGITWRGASTDVTNKYVSPAYSVWDAMASYETEFGRMKTHFQLNVRNLFNEVYYTGAAIYSSYGAYGVKQYGDPRSVMASLKLEY